MDAIKYAVLVYVSTCVFIVCMCIQSHEYMLGLALILPGPGIGHCHCLISSWLGQENLLGLASLCVGQSLIQRHLKTGVYPTSVICLYFTALGKLKPSQFPFSALQANV